MKEFSANQCTCIYCKVGDLSMKKKVTKTICRVSLIVSLIAGTVLPDNVDASNQYNNKKVAYHMNSEFKESAYEAIVWAKRKGIISPYEDGTFKLNDLVTEAQFAKMLSKFLGLKDDQGNLIKNTSDSHWADEYYDCLAAYSTPLNGYFDNTLRNKPVKQGVVVQAIGHLTGNTISLSQAITFMNAKGIKTGSNFRFKGQFFDATNDITRAQVAALLYHMHKVGLEGASDEVVNIYNNQDELSLASLANEGISALNSFLRLGKLESETPNKDYTLANAKEVYIPIQTLMQQPELPNGCEIVSLTAILNYYGYDVSKLTMADQFLPKQALYKQGRKLYGPDPYKAYAGNPRSKINGWYSFAPPIVEAANNYMATQKDKLKAINISGSTKEQLLSYLNNGIPIVIWITLDLSSPSLGGRWYLSDTGEYYKAYTNLHAVVLNGYKEDVVHVMNPLKGQVEYNIDAFFKSYEEMGKHAVVLEREELVWG